MYASLFEVTTPITTTLLPFNCTEAHQAARLDHHQEDAERVEPNQPTAALLH
jgi:hypothetical protein